MHDGLRQLAVRVFPDGRHHDPSGQLRLTVPAMDWDAYVHLAFDEIRLAGAGSPGVSRRLVAALDDPLALAPANRRAVLEEQLRLLREAVDELQGDGRDTAMALSPDVQGIGVAAGDGAARRERARSASADGRSGGGAADHHPAPDRASSSASARAGGSAPG